ncbi:uncharacterized protein LOC124225205 [Equus quagga]|uniref:uncharacterized protein LOC124225205 n=1 Tax=Equus quagga TaxID=89248 RepID=UPI001EE1C3D0|nr:uncharacterized protein LOC124225205 [Equus quagga]XP_046493672.1 uncharacterized protein LOC124225205 [Equus quagga]
MRFVALLIHFCSLYFPVAAWLDNSLVRIAQTIANSTQAVDCWICLPRAQSTADHGDPLVHPVSDFTQVPDGDWVPTRDLRARTLMYRVRISHFPHENPADIACLTLPLSSSPALYWTQGPQQIPEYFEMAPPPPSGQLPMCAQRSARYPAEDIKSVVDYSFLERPWMERTGFKVGYYFYTNSSVGYYTHIEGESKVFCAPPGHVFVCKINNYPWATECLHNFTVSTQCLLGNLVTPFSLHSLNESKHWASSLKLYTRVARDLPGNVPARDEYFFGSTLLPWRGGAGHPHVLRSLSRTLTVIANETAKSLINAHASLDSLAKVVLDNRMALDYMLAERGGVCAVANASCCTYINTSSQVETSVEKIRRQATWLQQPLGPGASSALKGVDAGVGGWFLGLSSRVPAGIRSTLSGVLPLGFSLLLLVAGVYLTFKLILWCVPGICRISTETPTARKENWQKHLGAFCLENPLASPRFSRKQPDDRDAPFP